MTPDAYFKKLPIHRSIVRAIQEMYEWCRELIVWLKTGHPG